MERLRELKGAKKATFDKSSTWMNKGSRLEWHGADSKSPYKAGNWQARNCARDLIRLQAPRDPRCSRDFTLLA